MINVIRRSPKQQEDPSGKGFSDAIMGYAQQKEQKEAAGKLGINPEIFNLPKEAQAEYFKNQFAQEKGMTPLQQSQLNLNEQKLKTTQDRQALYQRLMGNTPQNINPNLENQPTENQPQLSPQQQTALSQMPEDHLDQLAAFAGQPGEEGIIGNIAKAEKDNRKKAEENKRKNFTEDRTYHSKMADEAAKKADNIRESIPRKESALNFSRQAIEEGDLSYFSADKLADATGIDLFRTAKGAQLITAGKENLLSNMSRVSSKAQNLWFEQKLSSMFPKIGQSLEANLTIQEMIEGETALDKAYLEQYDRLVAEDNEKYGFEKKDIERRARAATAPLEQEIFKRTNFRIKQIEEQEKGATYLKSKVGKNVTKGTPMTPAMAKLYKNKYGENALDVAKKNGYYVPTLEEFKTFQMQPQEYREDLIND